MARSIPALVNRHLLRWARETAGFDLAAAAGKIHRSESEIQAWESGAGKPTVAQLKDVARVYKRPMAAFYLPETPADSTSMRDLRRIPDEAQRAFSSDLRLLVRSARDRQRWLREILSELGQPPVQAVGSASRERSSEEVGRDARTLLGITLEVQRRWSDIRQALEGWVEAMEDSGVFVFQSTDVELTEMRGFALPDPLASAIMVNAKDAPAGRIFTALHEFVHILLGEEGVSNLELPDNPTEQADAIEVYCNAVAAEILVPARSLGEVIEHDPRAISSDLGQAIEDLSRRYKVSREVIARRLLRLGFIDSSQYAEKRMQYQQEFRQVQKPTQFWGPSPARKALRNNGHAFTRAMLTAYNRDLITPSELSRLLGAKLRWLPKIEEAAFPIGSVRGPA
jgi:Zn-dependent peptidase ImmA (M78 family)/transcriptional regulator with XRE-family HTH domain